MQKNAKALNVLYRLRFPIIAVVVVAVAATLTFVGLNGTAKSIKLDKTEYTYGENPSAIGESMFGKALVQYAHADKDDWSYDVPTRAGSYKARSVSKNGYGANTYSKAKTFTIAPRPLNINVTTTELTYGNDIVYTPDLIPGDKIEQLDFVFADNYNEVNPFGNNATFDTKISVDMATLKILDSELNDVTYCYSYDNPSKDIKIKKRTLHLVSSETTKQYDGSAITNENYYVSQDTSLAEGDEISLSEVTSQTEVGSVNMKSSARIMHGEIDRTAFYDITWNTPKLTVTKRPLTISTNSISRNYNGHRLSSAENTPDEDKLYYSINNGSILDSHELIVTSFASETAYRPLQNSTNSIEYKIVDEHGDDVTNKYYEVREDFGTININKINLSIQYKNFDEEFNYQTLQGGVDSTGLASTDTLSCTLKNGYSTDEINGINSLLYAYDFDVINSDIGSVSDCYNISVLGDCGSLIIRGRSITIQSNSLLDKTYDSIPFSSEDSTDLDHKLSITWTDKLLDGHHIEPTFYYENEIYVNGQNAFDVVIKDANDNDVTNLYSINRQFGQITTHNRDLTIKFSSNSWVYDGLAHSANSYFGTGENNQTGIATNDELVFTDSDYQNLTNVGSAINTRSFIISHNGVDVSQYYNFPTINQLYGYIDVTKREITVKYTAPQSKMYDGEPISVKAEDIELENVPYGFDYTLSVDGTGDHKLANEYGINLLSVNLFKESDPSTNLSDNFNFKFKNELYQNGETIHLGDFEITKKPISISTYSATKVYDSTSLTSQDAATQAGETEVWYMTGSGLVSGDTLQINSTSEITMSGTQVNTVSYTINSLDGDVTGCYDVTANFGQLVVEKASGLQIQFNSANSFVYDSYYHNLDYNYSISGLQGTDYFNYYPNSYCDVGTYPLEQAFSYQICNTEGYDVTYCYDSITVIGTPITITKRSIEIHMNDFNQDALNKTLPSPYNYYINGSTGNDNLEVSFVGTEAEIREQIDNNQYPTIQYNILHNDGYTNAIDNYDVTVSYGSIVRNIIEVTIYMQSYSYPCNGEEFDVSNQSWLFNTFVYASNLPSNYYLKGLDIYCGEAVKYPGNYTISLINKENVQIVYKENYYSEEVDATDYFHITFASDTSTFTLTKRNIYITETDMEMMYDGQKRSIPFSSSDLIYGHHIEVANGVYQKDAGTFTNVVNSEADIIVKDAQGNDVTFIYNIVLSDSIRGQTFTTTIDKMHIKIQSFDYKKTFDGLPITKGSLYDIARYNSAYCPIVWFDVNGDGEYDYSSASSCLGIYYKANLYGGDYVIISLPDISDNYHVGTCDNEFEVQFYDGETGISSETTDNYVVEYEYGTLEIEPLEIYYDAKTNTTTYNGSNFVSYDDLTNNKNELVILSLGNLPQSVYNYIVNNQNSAYAFIDSNEITFMAGYYPLSPTFVIMYNGQNLIETGDIVLISNNGDIKTTINKKSLVISNEAQQVVIGRWNKKASEKLSVSGYISGDTVYIGEQQWKSSITDYTIIQDMTTAGTYGADYMSLYVNDSTVRVYRKVNGATVDVTSCYSISYSFKNIVVTTI